MEANTQEARMRTVFGPDSLGNLQDMEGVDSEGIAFEEHLKIGDAIMAKLGHPNWEPLLRGLTYCDLEHLLDLPFVLGATEKSTDDQAYIKWIAQASIDD